MKKVYLTVQSNFDRIFGAGITKDEAQKDALQWTESLEGTVTIYAEVDVNSISEIDAHTNFKQIETV